MILEISWELPGFIKQEVRGLLSSDGQAYRLCSCGVETRIPPEFASADAMNCKACRRPDSLRPICHRRLVALRCGDCGQTSEVAILAPERPRCPNPTCTSRNVEERGSKIDPPFPRTFVDFLSGDTWGEDYMTDVQAIMQEMQPIALLPDWGPQMLLWVRFLQRIREFSYQDDFHAQCMLLNVEANVLRDYFKRTLVLEAGILALKQFQSIVPLLDEPFEKAAIEHNVAMAAYSLIAKAEHMVPLMLGEIDLRKLGYDAGLRAMEGYRSISFDSQARELGRVHHLLGDILAAGAPGETKLHEAMKHFDKALVHLKNEPGLSTGVRVSRVNVQAKLGWPEGNVTEEAVRDLRAMLAIPESGRLWPQQHEPYEQLAGYYLSKGDSAAAKQALEKAAALALSDIENSMDETSLHAQAKLYGSIFSALSGTYAALGQASEALAAAEALRGASIRIHTMSDEDRQRRVEAFVKRSMEQLMFGEKKASTPTLRLPNLDTELSSIRSAVPDLSLAAIDFGPAGGAVVLERRSKFLGFQRRSLSVDTWTPDNKDLQFTIDELSRFRIELMDTDSPSRERDQHKLLSSLSPQLLEPIQTRLKTADTSDLLLITPGPLFGLPIEAEPEIWASGKTRFKRGSFKIRNVPSVGVAADIARRQRNNSGRMLIVGYAGSDLESVAEEINGLKQLFGAAATVMTGAELSKGRVLAELGRGYQYVHFCCHGSFDMLAPETSALLLSKDESDDSRRVSAADLRQVNLKGTSLVTLSACSTGAASVDSTNDLFGITGSMLRAGACAIVGSRWEVSDSFAHEFMAGLYGRIKKGVPDAATAFDQTAAALSQNERLENWAAFTFVGI